MKKQKNQNFHRRLWHSWSSFRVDVEDKAAILSMTLTCRPEANAGQSWGWAMERLPARRIVMSELSISLITRSRKKVLGHMICAIQRLDLLIIPIFTNHLMLPYLPHYQHYFKKTSTLIYWLWLNAWNPLTRLRRLEVLYLAELATQLPLQALSTMQRSSRTDQKRRKIINTCRAIEQKAVEDKLTDPDEITAEATTLLQNIT